MTSSTLRLALKEGAIPFRAMKEGQPFTHWGEVAESFDVAKEEQVAALTPLLIWTAEDRAKRLHWWPRKPLMLMPARLPKAYLPPVLQRYNGCMPWVDLDQRPSIEGSEPVLSGGESRCQWETARKLLTAATANPYSEVAR